MVVMTQALPLFYMCCTHNTHFLKVGHLCYCSHYLIFDSTPGDALSKRHIEGYIIGKRGSRNGQDKGIMVSNIYFLRCLFISGEKHEIWCYLFCRFLLDISSLIIFSCPGRHFRYFTINQLEEF